MNQQSIFLNDVSTSKALFLSLGVHLLIIALLYGFHVLDLVDDTKLTLVKSAVRVDVVGMPKYTLKELKQMQAQAESVRKESAAKEIKVKSSSGEPEFLKQDAKAKKDSKKSLDQMLKNLSRKQLVKKKNKKNVVAKVDPKINQLVMLGNKLSKGESLFSSGEGEELEGEFADYIFKIPDLVRKNWKLPTYLIDQGLQCRIRLYIGKDGDILNTKVVKSSGVEEFDRRAVRAVKQSAPFPVPSRDIQGRLQQGEVVLGFPL